MKPIFIPSQSGHLFCIFYPPADNAMNRAILHVPAFAEEMNKSRRMVSLQANTFAKQGYAVLVLDLFGTGDSFGEFGEATFDIWLKNIGSAIDWLKQQGAHSVDLWGLRTGCLLAMAFTSLNLQKIGHLLCWQPVLNGDTFITQFLRLRVAAAMMDSNAPKEKTSDLKQKLQAGKAIEVAGYLLNPDLISPLMALRADQLNLELVDEIAIFEVVSSSESPVGLGNSQFISSLHEKNVGTSLTKVVGDLFWSSQEICEAIDLIGASEKKLAQWL